ncbi:hypothetical protein FB567DRAFT_518817 [Paraphoma chrysanthemicola]|uniref:Uncharacterized protein n=1 Tax=Paraphoma chrysanthemicola TaxID=798071 RepID=A0A8K0RCQ4_9PLEO|nr:hypothetical protein FB567DRAFT_518817 [Paraphoma chrysanthemicola]
MLFNLKYTVLLGLAATTFALPIPDPAAEVKHLIARAKIPANVDCDGVTFSDDLIRQTIYNSRTSRPWGRNKSYPDFFGNQAGGKKLFTNIPDTTNLYGQPLTNPAWVGTAEPGRYRVVVNEKYGYVGVMQHLADVSNSFKLCVGVQEINLRDVNLPDINPSNLPGRV